MHVETAAEIRAQAMHARGLANEMRNHEAQTELRQIADALDTQADELETGQAYNEMPPP